MSDVRAFDTPVDVERTEAAQTIRPLLEEVEGASTPYAERYNNPHLLSSPMDLLLTAIIDPQVREVHGRDILVGALARIVAHQQERIEKLEAAQLPKASAKK